VTTAIRTPEMSDGASRVSALPEVRTALLGLQRRIGAAGGVVVEGRDIGTVVFPDADHKFFVTASPEVRARRRASELGVPEKAPAILEEMRRRDRADTTRPDSPLRRAEDAVLVDTDGLDAAAAAEVILARIRAAKGTRA